jgi:hypothetical protein
MAAHCVAIGSEMELPVFSTKIPASRTANATLGQSTMRRVFLGLLFFSLTACRGAFGGAGAQLRFRRFAGKAVAGWPKPPFQEQQAGLKGPA